MMLEVSAPTVMEGEAPAAAGLATGYASWQADSFLSSDIMSGPGQDYDGDGRSNFFSYAFDLDPKAGAAANPDLEWQRDGDFDSMRAITQDVKVSLISTGCVGGIICCDDCFSQGNEVVISTI